MVGRPWAKECRKHLNVNQWWKGIQHFCTTLTSIIIYLILIELFHIRNKRFKTQPPPPHPPLKQKVSFIVFLRDAWERPCACIAFIGFSFIRLYFKMENEKEDILCCMAPVQTTSHPKLFVWKHCHDVTWKFCLCRRRMKDEIIKCTFTVHSSNWQQLKTTKSLILHKLHSKLHTFCIKNKQ